MNMRTARPVSQAGGEERHGVKPGRPRNPAVDAAILDAARSLLAEVGCGAFNMEAVATRAGVGKQALYRRWPSRGDLLIDLYYLDNLTEPDLDQPELGLADALGAFLDANLQRLYRPWNRNLLRSLAVAAQDDPALREVFLQRITQPRLEVGRQVLRRAMRSGEARPDLDVDMLLDFMIGAIWFHLLFDDGPFTGALRQRILREALALAAPRSP